MNEKLPYYMAYPLPFSYENDRVERMDFEYMKSMYPEIPKRILPYVEEECDRMEYENSVVYDQYPDKLQMKLMCGRVCEKIDHYEQSIYTDRNEAIDAAQVRDLVEVLVYQELYKRRCEHRQMHCRIY